MRELHVRIPDAYLEVLEEIGWREDRTVAWLIRRALREALQTPEIFARHDISRPATSGTASFAVTVDTVGLVVSQSPP